MFLRDQQVGKTQQHVNPVGVFLMMMQIFAAFAEFERNRIKERTREGLERARSEGKKLGRPEAKATTRGVQEAKQEGLSQSQAAHHLGLSIATVKRHWNK